MDTRTLIRAIAARLAAVDIPGLRGVSFPPTDKFKASPWLMVRQSRDFPTQYGSRRAGMEIVTVPVDLIVLVQSTPDNQRDDARIDPLIEPILDALDADAHGMSPADLLGLPAHHIDHIRTEADIDRNPRDWGQVGYCHAVRITIDPQYRRKPQPVPLRSTP